MDVEGEKCNGLVELEKSPGKVLVTYKRRKRDRSSSDVVQVLERLSRRTRDIGWNHGEIVNGNRFHWMCKWCGLIRYGGGVSRLKRHLAGACHVRKCPNVPEEISKSIMHHLMEKKKKHRKKRSTRASDSNRRESSNSHSDDVALEHAKNEMLMPMASAARLNEKATMACKNTKTGTQALNITTQCQRKNAQLPKAVMSKGTMDPCEHASSCPEWHARIIGHWKNVIEHQLNLSYMEPGLGIWNVLHDALSLGHSELPQRLKTYDSIRVNDKLKDVNIRDSEVKTQCEKLNCVKAAKERTIMESKSNYYEEDTNTRKCEKAFLEILISYKFALLCDFLLETFDKSKTKFLLDFSLIDIKLKNGDYERSPQLFNQDIQQIWNQVQKIGQEMTILASSLSSVSRSSRSEQVLGDSLVADDEPKHEETCPVDDGKKNSAGSHATTQFPCCGSDCSTKPNPTEASDLYKSSTCQQCGSVANGVGSLICDGCEAMYHFSCIQPPIKEIPTSSWYCAACSSNNKDPADPVRNENKKDSLHHNCVVCDRLEVSDTIEDPDDSDKSTSAATDSGTSSVSSMESEEPAELSRTAISRLCKICGMCEDENKKFLLCGHIHCPYKFYHIRCLKSSQIASPQQHSREYWYCPSCLCRACLCDKDDNKIVLCDGCDEAYHTYCMKPPRTTVPKGQWYCISCNVARAREGMRRYEQWIFEQHRKNEGRQPNGGIGSMDLLLSAAEKLSSDEKLASR